MEAAKKQERYWIQYYITQAPPLVNKQHTRSISIQEMECTIQEMDLYGKAALVYFLELDTCGKEAVTEFRTVGTWLKRNSRIYWFAGHSDDSRQSGHAWASLSILPLEESLIRRLLSGELSRYDIQAKDILHYEASCSYSCLN